MSDSFGLIPYLRADAPAYTERILDDGTDRAHWLESRTAVIGASDAAKLSKRESVHLYLASKLSHNHWNGNSYSESGNRWEPLLLAWAGIPSNRALIHSPAERGFAATPDGLQIGPSGGRGAECKARHGKSSDGPTLGEWRQVAWQFVALPEFTEIEFIWQQLVVDNDTGEFVPVTDEPRSLTIHRNNPKIVSLTDTMLPIATDLLARLTAALAFEKEMETA